MATKLDQYISKKVPMEQKLTSPSYTPEDLMRQQELLYRIAVLETFKIFSLTIPITRDARRLSQHYNIVDAYITCVLNERRFGFPTGEAGKKQQEAAHNNLMVVATTFKNGFKSFVASSDTAYQEKVMNMINAFLPAWVSYRNTYISI